MNNQTHNIELLKEAKSVPLGILPNIPINENKVRLNKGDLLVSITDGIIEAKNKVGQLYSMNRTLDNLSKNGKTVDQLVDSLIKDVQDFASGVQQYDDLTILALKWQGLDDLKS
jgi:sigma-B regulation protein RsbU (phosphoserine phosphatase)